mmetsp:Transcript_8685/g.27749  ORF Transcript_8685/g.27749 Transcript_8685/m.27749 type:complete len:218 (+) Transcript_8685:1435-2088(+)
MVLPCLACLVDGRVGAERGAVLCVSGGTRTAALGRLGALGAGLACLARRWGRLGGLQPARRDVELPPAQHELRASIGGPDRVALQVDELRLGQVVRPREVHLEDDRGLAQAPQPSQSPCVEVGELLVVHREHDVAAPLVAAQLAAGRVQHEIPDREAVQILVPAGGDLRKDARGAGDDPGVLLREAAGGVGDRANDTLREQVRVERLRHDHIHLVLL